jgi:2-keto-4-pentenoate hydratase/2-oxohepta-3-ene-1,7-dioic acid hydratase in catechol pathway
MKILSYSKDGSPRLGLKVDADLYDLEGICASVNEWKTITRPTFFENNATGLSMLGLIKMGDEGLHVLNRIQTYIRWHRNEGDPYLLRSATLNEEEIEWLPPIESPPVLYGIGGNSPLFFRDKNYQIPAYPRGFMRPTGKHGICAHRGTVIIPKNYATMRASAEMGVVIGKEGRNIPETDAMNYVYGFTLVNDMCSDSWKVVALQGADESMMHKDLTVFTQRAATSYYSRSTDTFAAIGPYIVTKDEIPDPYNLMVWNRLNGITRERGYTQAMVNSIERTVSFMSRILTLKPGMIFHMGTMGIDGYTIEADMQLGEDDYFEIEYERIGILRSYIKDLRNGNRAQ